MVSKSRFNALSEIYKVSFYDQDGDSLARYHEEDQRLECMYVSVPTLQYGDYCGGIYHRGNIEYLEETLEEGHWKEITGYYAHRELLLKVTGKYFEETLDIVKVLEAYPIYNESYCNELEHSLVNDLWFDSGHDEFLEAIAEYLISWPKLSKARSCKVWARLCEDGGELYNYGSGDDLYFNFEQIEKQCDLQEKIDQAMAEIFPDFTASALACTINTDTLPFVQLQLTGV